MNRERQHEDWIEDISKGIGNTKRIWIVCWTNTSIDLFKRRHFIFVIGFTLTFTVIMTATTVIMTATTFIRRIIHGILHVHGAHHLLEVGRKLEVIHTSVFFIIGISPQIPINLKQVLILIFILIDKICNEVLTFNNWLQVSSLSFTKWNWTQRGVQDHLEIYR